MKLFVDLLPVLLFFIAFKTFDIYVATAVLMVACTVQVTVLYLWKRKVEKLLLVAAGGALVFGTLTLTFRNPDFIKLKPTIVNGVLATIFLAAPWVTGKFLVQTMMEKVFDLAPRGWARLNAAWVGFFLLCGAANLLVAYTVSEAAWVNFRLFGLTGMSFAFILLQVFALQKYLRKEDPTPS